MLNELFGAIERGLGALLSGIYDVIPNYGIAIVLLTVAVRVLLIPMTVKQIRGMAATQKLQPEMAKIKQKYKQLQQKAKDRMEVQQLRLKMNEEIQSLFKANNIHPASGCLPLLAQMPFFFALFAVVRATIVVIPATVTFQGAPVTAETYTKAQADKTICRPVSPPSAEGAAPTTIECVTDGGPVRRLDVGGFTGLDGQAREDVGWITHCRPKVDDGRVSFTCQSALSTGHIPAESKLFRDLTQDRASFLGMHPGCRPADASNDFGKRTCTSTEDKGGAADALPYFLLVLAIAATQYYQSKQMMQRMKTQGTDLSPQAQSQQMTMKIMPLVFGFLSFTLPAGSNVYFLATNVWTIGQQHIVFSRQQKREAEEAQAEQSKKIVDAKPKQGSQPAKPNPNASKKKRKKSR